MVSGSLTMLLFAVLPGVQACRLFPLRVGQVMVAFRKTAWSPNQSLGMEWFFAADRAEWSTGNGAMEGE